ELDFLHNGFTQPGTDGHTEALLATGGWGPAALGFGVDWLHRSGAISLSSRRTSYGAALRLGTLGIGAVYRTRTSSYDSWVFGALLRPTSWLSLGAAALAADEPQSGGVTAPRRWAFALGIRPTGGRFELAADLRWSQCTAGAGSCGIDRKDIFFTGTARLADGVRAIGQAGFLQTGYIVTQHFGLIGLQLDLANLGVSGGPRFASDLATQSDWRIRVSTEKWQSISLPFGRAALIDLKKALARPRPGAWSLLFGTTARDPLSQTLQTLRRLAADGAVKAVVVKSAG